MTDLSHIYKKLHENRWYHVEQARKARDMQEIIAGMSDLLERCAAEVNNSWPGCMLAKEIKAAIRSARANTPAHQGQPPSE